jgi:hypothetical protein
MPAPFPLHLVPLDGRFAVCRLDPDADLPAWAFTREAALWSVTRTRRELSVVVEEAGVPPSVARVEPGWRGLALEGPVPFETVGVFARLTGALAAAGVPLFALSTFDTDVLLVKQEHLARAVEALRAAGVTVAEGASRG